MNKKLLLGLGAAAVLYYFFKNKTAVSTGTNALVPITTGGGAFPQTKTVVAPIIVAEQKPFAYPYGFVEGDFLQNPNEQTVYLLHQGKKLPVTYNWWMANAKDSWDLVKIVPVAQYMDIPTGATLDA